MPTSPVGCSTECTARKNVQDTAATPSRPVAKRKGNIILGVKRKKKKSFVRLEEPTAKRVAKFGGMEYFEFELGRLEKEPQTQEKVILITSQRTPRARDEQLPYPTYGKGQRWFP